MQAYAGAQQNIAVRDNRAPRGCAGDNDTTRERRLTIPEMQQNGARGENTRNDSVGDSEASSFIPAYGTDFAHLLVSILVLVVLTTSGGVRSFLSCKALYVLFDPRVVLLRMPHQERSSFTIQRVVGVRVAEQLREEHLEDVDHVEHRRPSLVDHVQAYRSTEFIDIGMEYLVHEPDTGRLEGVLVRQLNVDLPYTSGERSLGGSIEPNIELLHVIVHEIDLVIRH